MKNAIFIILLCFVTIRSQAQTDSIYRREIVRKVNEYRKSKNLQPLQLNQKLNRAVEDIIKKGYTFKDNNGNFIKDSVRKELRFKGIYDYQIDISESTDIEKTELNDSNKQISSLQSATIDPELNCVGIAKNKNQEIVILSKHYIEFDFMVYGSIKLPDPTDSRSQINTETIKGNTELDNLTICIYDSKANVETDEPLSRKPLVKKGKYFEIEMNVTSTQTRIPFKVTLVNENGLIVSQFNLSNI